MTPDSNSAAARGEATLLLGRMADGDSRAAADLLPIVYDRLRAIAGSYFRSQPSNHTLQPTALVHEAYLKLVGSDANWKDRAHFCAVAATAMRQILSNHARGKNAAKRSGDLVEYTLEAVPATGNPLDLDLLDLDAALTELGALNPRHARLIELRFFGGLGTDEIAHVLELSSGMVRREWRAVRAWLLRRLDESSRS